MAADRFFDCDGWERRDGSSRVYATGAMLKPGQSSLGLTIILENSEKLVGAFCKRAMTPTSSVNLKKLLNFSNKRSL